VTDAERIDRGTLLKRAAVGAAFVWSAPVLSASAEAAVLYGHACVGQPCKSDKKCFRKGGTHCKCIGGKCTPQFCPCTHNGGQCGVLEPCGANCGCFQNEYGTNPGYCVDLRDGLCSSFTPCRLGCDPGQVCFVTCCGERLCGDCCRPGGSKPQARAGSGSKLHK
jgi:hypothetical protein